MWQINAKGIKYKIRTSDMVENWREINIEGVEVRRGYYNLVEIRIMKKFSVINGILACDF